VERCWSGIQSNIIYGVSNNPPGVEGLIGSGVYYGSAIVETAFHRGGNVFVVGGANSAGQVLQLLFSGL
jgi:thioredoxin reductase